MPDAQRAEIAKLETLHAEHPQGRIFTHLAEAYRKAGELDRAETVLREGIERHPDYSSAHVVLARVLMDKGQAPEAESEFRRVLELDSHNLVALRSLGDLARGQGRTDDALGYYEKLLDVEPADEDVRDLVEGLARGDGTPRGEPGLDTWDGGASPDATPEVAAGSPPGSPEPGQLGGGADAAGDRGDQGLATETIAQVYARQGLYDRAADVYRHLLNSRPGDDGIRSKLEEMEALAEAPPPGTEPGPPFQDEPSPADEIEWGQTMEGFGQEDADADGEPDWQTDAPWEPPQEEVTETEPDEERFEFAGEDQDLGSGLEDQSLDADVAEMGSAGVEDGEGGELDAGAPEDVEPVAGLAVPDYSAGAEVEPLDGLETDATDFRLGFDEEPQEPEEGDAVAPLAGFETASEEQSAEAGAPESETAEPESAEPESAEPETVESVWTGASGAQDETETPYAWADPEPEADDSRPVGEYLRGLLDWSRGGEAAERGAAAEPEPRLAAEPGVPAEPEAAAEEAATAEAALEAPADTPSQAETPDPGAEAPQSNSADEDDDLDMFRSWLESLKE